MMCLSTVFLRSMDNQEQVMRDVARIESENGGFWLINLFGERQFVEGSLQSIDLVDENFAIFKKKE